MAVLAVAGGGLGRRLLLAGGGLGRRLVIRQTTRNVVRMYRICVTGGSGFLGKHLIRLLAKDSQVKKILSLDVKPLDLKSTFPDEDPGQFRQVEVAHVDVTDKAAVVDATNDCDVIFNIAAYVDFRLFPDVNKLDAVNRIGTENVVNACLRNNVPRLVHTSSIDVSIGSDDHVIGDSRIYPKNPLIYHYGVSKRRGEMVALGYDKARMDNGEELRVLVTRPHSMYGEGETFMIPPVLVRASRLRGVHPLVGYTGSLTSTYVGNVAWCLIQAWKTSLGNPSICGHPYIIHDDTPRASFSSILLPYLEGRGCRFSRVQMPFLLTMNILRLVQVVMFCLKFFIDVNMSVDSGCWAYIHRKLRITETRNHKKDLNYQPLFDHKTALERSLLYFNNLDLSKMKRSI